MKRIRILLMSLMVLLAAIAPAPILAHDAKLHKGKATEGEVVSLAGDQLTLKTKSGTVKVRLNEKTKIEHDGQTVDRSHVQNGERVSVFGTKLASGELVATEIQMGAMDHSKMPGMDKGKKEKK